MSTSFDLEPGRLNGWKEIASHLGKGTRTVQRWEKLYGLPVHRMGREGGEIVYAFRDEIDRWLAATEHERAMDGAEGVGLAPGGADASAPDDASRPLAPAGRGDAGRVPGRGRRLAAAGAVLAAGAVTIGGVAMLTKALVPSAGARATVGHRQPTTWRLAGEALTVFDETGAPLFVHGFGVPLQGVVSSDTVHPSVGPSWVQTTDVDGDGRSEVLVNLNAVERAERKLYCFEADGRLRFVHQPTGTRRFGDEEYGEPWLGHKAFVTRGPDGRRRLFATFTHNLWFPAVLRELDPRNGTVLQEYWSNGYIEMVHQDTWAGRPVLLVAGTNNDSRAASLAVFAPDRVTGSAPAVRPGYACRDCVPGAPGAFFLFPTLCTAPIGGQASVHEVWVEQGQRLRVTVAQVGVSRSYPAVYYVVGPDGELLDAEISPEFQADHARLERDGMIDHPFGPRDDRDMFPVRRWDGRRFVELAPVPVGH